MGSLLEVGTGFHPELTGRENIFLNGAILGMRRTEIRRQFDEIVAFADIERFLDTPVKRYSSGMYVRLAFSVAAHLQTEVLIVDEVLAVGDAAFQRKSLGRMGEVAREGRTVLFVSHNMAVIQSLCHRGHLPAGRPGAVRRARRRRDRGLPPQPGAGQRDRPPAAHRPVRLAPHHGRRRRRPRGTAGAAVSTGAPARFSVTLTGLQPSTSCTLTVLNNLGQPVFKLESGNASAPRTGTTTSPGPTSRSSSSATSRRSPCCPVATASTSRSGARTRSRTRSTPPPLFDVEAGVLAGRPVASTSTGDVTLEHRWTVPTLLPAAS